ncbi:Splicing factor [Coemansia sp. RSA 2603]|nr:Splicing factor [Coemansia sp. RSA 2603]
MLKRDKQTPRKEILVLYERAIVHNRYSAEVWDEYITYAARCASEADLATSCQSSGLSVVLRATRCCPWSGKIWGQLVYTTFQQHGYDAAAAVYGQAVSTHAVTYSMAEFSQVAIALIDITRLKCISQTQSQCESKQTQELFEVCETCLSTAYTFSLETADPMLHLERYSTSIVVGIIRNVEAARKMWLDICSSRKVCAEAWVLFAQFEETHGSVDDARSVYRRASQRRLDNIERVFSTWVAFEHIHGNMETMWSAEEVINTQRRVEWRRVEKMTGGTTVDVVVQSDAVGQVTEPAASRADNMDGSEGKVDKSDTLGYVKSAKRRRLGDDDGDGDDNINSEGGARSGLDKKVIFISGLPLSCTEADIKTFLGSPETVRQIEMLTNKDGQFRGQAKATLGSMEAVIAALDKSGQKINDSFVSVHVFKQHGHSQKAKGEATVKVSGFSAETGNKKLEEIAKKSGAAVVRVRRNQSGDVAFVSVRTQRDAYKAADVMNGSVVDGKTLSARVDRDDVGSRVPSGKRQTGEKAAKEAAGLTKVEAAETAAQKPSVGTSGGGSAMLVPRKAASKKQQPSKRLHLGQKTAGDSGGGKDGGSETARKQTDRTNDDFRRLFMGEGAE